jgi:hypothetical protein
MRIVAHSRWLFGLGFMSTGTDRLKFMTAPVRQIQGYALIIFGWYEQGAS